MNCRPGDLAVVVNAGEAVSSGWAGEVAKRLVGSIVRLVRLRPPDPAANFCYAALVWEFESPIAVTVDSRTGIATGIADECLRPIRPSEGADETLQWREVPRELETLDDCYARGA